MSTGHSAPRAEERNVSLLSHLVSIYPSVLKSFYKNKVKGEAKQRTQASEDDIWRYELLPAKLQTRNANEGLKQEELERLVKWKITHQTFRPFLLPQIRKNEATTVEKCTAEARQILSAPESLADSETTYTPSREVIRRALDKVCELKGVGPATGTLILSVFDDGQNIPFFEDELYAWLFPQSKSKLKYNQTEYFELLDKFKEIRSQGITNNQKEIGTAEAYEKVAFICQHWDCLDNKEKTSIASFANGEQMAVPITDEANEDHDERAVEPQIPTSSTKQGKTAAKGGMNSDKRKATEKEVFTDLRRSKRQREQ